MRRPRAAGFTLLELLLAFLISMTALLLAGRLLLESQGRMSHAARRALDPVGELAGRQLRADLRAATGVAPPGLPGWSYGPLVLKGHPIGALSYVRNGTELVRGSGRVVLFAVTTFRWRLHGRAVEIDLRFRSTPRWGRLAAGGTREAPIPSEERLLFRVTPRGGGGWRW